jgi:hypothetical protein
MTDEDTTARSNQAGASKSSSPADGLEIPTQKQLIKKWASAFGNYGGPISMVLCVLLVTTYRPSPGRALPMSWSIGIVVGTVVFIAAISGLGALFGYLLWRARYGSER